MWWRVGAALVMLALVMLALVILAACRDAPRKDGTVMRNPGPEAPAASTSSVRLKFESVSLGMSLDELLALATAGGWKQNAQPGGQNQKVTVFPPDGDPVDRYKLGFEAGRLVNIQLEYAVPDPARVAALRAGYPRSKHGDDGGWNLADTGGETLVFIDDTGKELQALHTGVLRDRTEVAAIFRQALGEAPAGGPPAPLTRE